jgi:hypothetical protein
MCSGNPTRSGASLSILPPLPIFLCNVIGYLCIIIIIIIIIISTLSCFVLKKIGLTPEIQIALEDLRHDMNTINMERYRQYDEDINAAINNAAMGVLYQRVSDKGPKLNNGRVGFCEQ